MDVSLGLFPTESPRRLLDVIRLAEELGYHAVYVGDSQMIWREAFALLGAAALVTSRIRLGPGVTNPITRDPAVVAAAVETLVELAGPRIVLGIGAGDSSLRTLGKRPATLSQLESSIGFIRGLLSGQELPHPDSGAPARLTYVQVQAPPVYVAVSSPKIHRLAGRVADGAIVLVGTDPAFLAASRRELACGASQVGKPLGRVVCWTPCSIQTDGRAARGAVKAHVARVLKRPLPFELDAATQQVVQDIRDRYAYYEHMQPGTPHGEVVPDDLVERFAVAGTLDEARSQIERLAASALVDEIAIIPHAADPGQREHIIREVGQLIR
jgi:5,10-methylenetetrahydromethanopterin reductase